MKLLFKYAKLSKFIIETGSGKSTKYLAKIGKLYGAKVYSIDVKMPKKLYRGSIYRQGWSINYEDFIKINHYQFIESQYQNTVDGNVIFHGECNMKGERNLIRKILKENNDIVLDFFFCDTGEYSGLAEWNIVKDVIQTGGRFAAHDIYYPKSIKCFQIVKEIEESDQWKVLLKTKSQQGLLIAEKL